MISWRIALANIKSQIKRNKQNEKRRLRNRVYSGTARSFLRKARTEMADVAKASTVSEEDLAAVRAATLQAISALDRAASKGVIHKNNAARRKGRLMKHLAALEKSL
jgi:small subunit ribosomal protein S20